MERLLDELALHSGGGSLINPLGNKDWCASYTRRRTVMGSAMTQTAFDPARLVLDLPKCQKCGSIMWLVQIEPDAPDRDRRTFECPRCENVVSETVKYR